MRAGWLFSACRSPGRFAPRRLPLPPRIPHRRIRRLRNLPSNARNRSSRSRFAIWPGRNLKPMPVRPLNVKSQCSPSRRGRAPRRASICWSRKPRSRLSAQVIIPKRGVCRFDLGELPADGPASGATKAKDGSGLRPSVGTGQGKSPSPSTAAPKPAREKLSTISGRSWWMPRPVGSREKIVMTQWEVVIGIETHAQLATRSKIFSGASTAFGAEPNSQACAWTLRCPGVAGAQQGCRRVRHPLRPGDRRRRRAQVRLRPQELFLPDLPKGYQISQFELPVVQGGAVAIQVGQGDRAYERSSA